jgi:hypothetical protein
MNVVDANVLVYSLDAGEPAKHAKAKALLAGVAKTEFHFDNHSRFGCIMLTRLPSVSKNETYFP